MSNVEFNAPKIGYFQTYRASKTLSPTHLRAIRESVPQNEQVKIIQRKRTNKGVQKKKKKENKKR